ncbi:MAG: hypothetical protein JRI85_16920 [Deltaproteobacteria bacterium]|nr:hypothetical protein [Deltaproteobacteria bacterium]
MKKRNLCIPGKIGILVLLVSFVFFPILPSVSFAFEGAAAGLSAAGGGGAGAGAGGLGAAGIGGLAASLAAVVGIVAAAGGGDGGVPTGHHGTTEHHCP